MQRITGKIVALDLASNTGWAVGSVGSKPSSISMRLRRHDDPHDVALENMWVELDREFRKGLPDLVAKEKMLHLAALALLKNNAENSVLQMKLHGVVEQKCRHHGIRWIDVGVTTARKHFVGIGGVTGGSSKQRRAENKMMVLRRCQLLGLIEKDTTPRPYEETDPIYNRADAICVWDYAAATFGGKSPSTEKLFLFGEG
jgi:hypothetical protein